MSMKIFRVLILALTTACGEAFEPGFTAFTIADAGNLPDRVEILDAGNPPDLVETKDTSESSTCHDLTLGLGDATESEELAATVEAPGEPGSTAQACIAFTTNNPASSRLFAIGSQEFCVGPCDGVAEPQQVLCVDYTVPLEPVHFRVDNTNCSPGCQQGTMSGVSLTLHCP